MRIFDQSTARKARKAIKPLEVGSRVEVELSGGEVRSGKLDGLNRGEVVIDKQAVALSDVSSVYHVTSQAHE